MLRRLTLAALLCCAGFAPLAAAPLPQDAAAQKPLPVDPVKEFQRGYEALTSGRIDEGIAIYTALFELQATNSGIPYNLACGYALKGDPAHAWEWLAKSVELGFGNTQINADQLEKNDKDLATLRTDERWPKLVERMKELKREFDAYAAAAAVYVPAKLQGAAELPLLVVLHGADGNKDTVVQGPWKAVADACGVALVAPSGRYPVGGLAANGVTWFDSVDNYTRSRFGYEKPVDAALIAFQKEHKVDKSRVFIAGDGVGGMLATTLALSYPAVYRGVIACDGLFVERLVGGKAKAAAKAGLLIDMLFTEPPVELPAAQRKELQDAIAAVGKKLQDWGFAGSAGFVSPGDAAMQAACTKALQAMLAAPRAASAAPTSAPAPAGGGK